MQVRNFLRAERSNASKPAHVLDRHIVAEAVDFGKGLGSGWLVIEDFELVESMIADDPRFRKSPRPKVV